MKKAQDEGKEVKSKGKKEKWKDGRVLKQKCRGGKREGRKLKQSKSMQGSN